VIDAASLDVLERVTKRLFAAKVFAKDVTTEDQAFAVILTGAEMGFEPATSARTISILHGKVFPGADAIVAACVRRGDVCRYFRCVDTTAALATYETVRVGDERPRRLTYTMQMAERGGAAQKNGTYRAHPEAMLRARCATALARSVYPDLVAGAYDTREDPSFEREAAAAAPADDKSAFGLFARDLATCARLADVHATWQAHARALHDADDAAGTAETAPTQRAAEAVGDWMGEHGYCTVATEDQHVMSGAWGDPERTLADALAGFKTGAEVVTWYVGARAQVEALRDPKSFKTFVARSWAARSGVEAAKPGNAFAKVVAAHLAAQETTREAAADEPAPPAPIVTSKGVELTSEAAVREHVGTIDNITRLENTAKKHGAHPWAVGPLVDRAAALLGMHPDEADVWVSKHATDGAKGGA
jgi:hypothetical protein